MAPHESTADIAAAVAHAVEALPSALRRTSQRPALAREGKRNRTDSHARSPPAPQKARRRASATGSLVDELRETKSEWQDRAVRAENELRTLRTQHAIAVREHRTATERWQHDREALAADELSSRAAARKYKYQRNDTKKEVKSLTEEVEKLRECVSQLTDSNQELGIRVPTLQDELTQAQGRIAALEQELEPLRQGVGYHVPNGKLQLRHVPSRNEVLWASTGSLPDCPQVNRDALEQSWAKVANALKIQQREFIEAWDEVDHRIQEDPTYDAYAAMYACIKQASDQIGMVAEQEAASSIPGVQPGRTLAEDVGDSNPVPHPTLKSRKWIHQ